CASPRDPPPPSTSASCAAAGGGEPQWMQATTVRKETERFMRGCQQIGASGVDTCSVWCSLRRYTSNGQRGRPRAGRRSEGDDMAEITCVRCGQPGNQLAKPPFRNELGERIFQSICQRCWDQWLRQQTALINHFGLDVREKEARDMLTANMEAFL